MSVLMSAYHWLEYLTSYSTAGGPKVNAGNEFGNTASTQTVSKSQRTSGYTHRWRLNVLRSTKKMCVGVFSQKWTISYFTNWWEKSFVELCELSGFNVTVWLSQFDREHFEVPDRASTLLQTNYSQIYSHMTSLYTFIHKCIDRINGIQEL